MADETNRNVNEQPQAQDMGELLRIRRDKLKALQDEGRDPFTITRFDVTHHTQDIKDNFDAMFGPAYKGIPLGVSTAIALMRVTKTLHPPGGATALIAVIGGADIHRLGYWYVLLPCGAGACCMLLLALLTNNLGARRRYPQTWW